MMLKYNLEGELVYAELRDFQMSMTDKQRQWLWGFIPKCLPELERAKGPSVKITEVETDLSFEAFWELYDHKVGNKKRAQSAWNKLNDNTRALVMVKVREYNYYMAHVTHAKVFPERFLAQKRYENDFKVPH